MNSDLTFITNEKGQNLKQRFEVLIKDTRLFDCLVGYFFPSGFHTIYKSLEKTEKIRILIGISTDQTIYEWIEASKTPSQQSLEFSNAEVKKQVEKSIEEEMEEADDNEKVENGVSKFCEWIKNGKLELRAFPSQDIHAKLYIMTFDKDDRDKGRVITGSSNFTRAGLVDNLEFNVELKNSADYEFAQKKFNELWEQSVDVTSKYIETIQTKTWLNDTVTPYDLYLKFLYEYFREDLKLQDEVFIKYLPVDFKRLKYQEQAVLNAKKILEEYGGVFISDVVGLGKTFITAMLAGQIEGRTLVLAPPVLLDPNNPGSWLNVFSDFRVPAEFESVGMLDAIVKRGVDKFQNIIIDESHRFRTENNTTYEKLAEICRGKRVILVTATPYNNSPKDILSQIKLFQKARKSTIPGLIDLEKFFSGLERKLKGLDRQRDHDKYIEIIKENAKEIREKVLKYLMVRRTRSEIIKYFDKDLEEQNLKFPEVDKPTSVFYQLNEKEDNVFFQTIKLLALDFKYTRYKPLLYYKGELSQPEELSQQNMGKFMKILLIKRLESSFYAFRNSLDRFINSYEQFLNQYKSGWVYISKKHINKVFELLDDEDDQAIEDMISEGKADKYPSNEFRPEFKKDLEADLKTLKQIREDWNTIQRDPKLLAFVDKLKDDPILKSNKLIIFTESKETAEYLSKNIEEKLQTPTLCYTGASGEDIRERVIENFDAKVRHPKDDYRILVCTEILAEGVNLHRSNVVINYDIPWNPTRMMQRVGRINRVDTKFDNIYTYNFFPTKQANDLIKLKEAAEAKINAFIELLGSDAHLLTDNEPIGSHELFDMLTSSNLLQDEDNAEDSDLKYLNVIKNLRDNDPDTFDRIKRIPKKARTACHITTQAQHHTSTKTKGGKLLSYFRRGKLQKFYIVSQSNNPIELDFISTAKVLEANNQQPRTSLDNTFYELLGANKQAFVYSTTDELPETKLRGGRDSATLVIRFLKASLKDRRQFTDDQELYLKKVLTQLEEGGLPKQTTKVIYQELQKIKAKELSPLKILAIVQTNIPAGLLSGHFVENTTSNVGKREVILSEYLKD